MGQEFGCVRAQPLSRVWLFATPWLLCKLPGSSVHGISQARILEWVTMSSSRGSSWPGIEPVSSVSPALAGGFVMISATWEAPGNLDTYHQSFQWVALSCRRFPWLREGGQLAQRHPSSQWQKQIVGVGRGPADLLCSFVGLTPSLPCVSCTRHVWGQGGAFSPYVLPHRRVQTASQRWCLDGEPSAPRYGFHLGEGPRHVIFCQGFAGLISLCSAKIYWLQENFPAIPWKENSLLMFFPLWN